MTQEVKLKRVKCNYREENGRFLLECDFSKQYHHYYRKRLERVRPFAEYNARSKWGSQIPLYNLGQLATICSYELEAWDDLTSQFLFSTSSSSSHSPDAPQESNYEFAKRLRRYSPVSPQEATSTPRSPPQNPTTEKSFLSLEATTPAAETKRGGSQARGQKGQETFQCIIIGTLFKRMKLQPSVIEELSKGDFNVKCERYLGQYTSSDDNLVLEDHEESILLVGNIDPSYFVTGVIVALLGRPINEGGQFLVQEVCCPEPNRRILYDLKNSSQQAIVSPSTSRDVKSEPIYLMVVSGLGFHPDMSKRSVLTKALQNLIDFIWGGGDYENDERSSRVARILVVGNNLSEDRLCPDEEESSQNFDILTRMKRSRQVKPYTGSIQAIKHMDDFFAQLSKTINVDVMPGPSDPSSLLMPQQPFHPCMFPKSCAFSSFSCTTNPHHAIYNDNVEIFTTSGQNIDIVSKFSGLKDPIDIMKCHLFWGNCAPSAPDNLYSAPYEDDDPYVIDFIPDVYIAGCQGSFRSEFYDYNLEHNLCDRKTEPPSSQKLETGDKKVTSEVREGLDKAASSSDASQPIDSKKSRTLLLTVPQFCESYSCVLLNLIDLQAQLISFC